MRDIGTTRQEAPMPDRRVGRRRSSAWSMVVVVAALATGGWLFGMRLLVEHSDSMAPALRTGDLLLVRRTPVTDLRPGDVVSFADPSRGGRLITHRVVETAHPATTSGPQVVTRGDANTATESIPADERVWTLAARLPRIGHLAMWLQGLSPAGVVFAGAVAVAVVARHDDGSGRGVRS